VRRLYSDQSGQSLVVVALAMVVVMGFAALAIDTASWYGKRHQAQVAADAASLAAANCLAHPNTGPTGAICTSSTDTPDAIAVAQSIASADGVTLPTSDISISTTNHTVVVTAPNTAPSYFAQIAGIGPVKVSAVAGAKFTAGGSTACSTDCGAMFAGGSCSSGAAISLSSVAGTINGAVVSDGNLSLSSISGNLTPETDYGPGCSYSSSSVSGSVPTPTQMSVTVPYPEDWRTGGNETLPTCTFTASSSTAGTYYSLSGAAWGTSSSGGYTDTMTVTSTNITISGSGSIPAGVYCAMSGTVTLSSYSGGASDITLIGQTVTFSSIAGGPLSPCTSTQNSSCPSGNVLLLYQTGGGTMNLGSISGSINGTVFAPSATISISSLSGGTGFMEGNSVTASSISGYVGNGPSNISTGGAASTGSDSLYQ
jgi:Putative Flp pilus-assembly TadE/G-like